MAATSSSMANVGAFASSSSSLRSKSASVVAIARLKDPTKEQRLRLFKIFAEENAGRCPMQTSEISNWIPKITQENVKYISARQNKAKVDEMIITQACVRIYRGKECGPRISQRLYLYRYLRNVVPLSAAMTEPLA